MTINATISKLLNRIMNHAFIDLPLMPEFFALLLLHGMFLPAAAEGLVKIDQVEQA
jgi:hypothetical protein